MALRPATHLLFAQNRAHAPRTTSYLYARMRTYVVQTVEMADPPTAPHQVPGADPDTAAYPPQQLGYQPAAYPTPQPGSDPQAPQPQQDTGYQPQPAIITTETNVAVIAQQPAARPIVYHKRYGNNDHGLLFAIIATCGVFWFGGCCGLICTLAGVYFAIQAQDQENLGHSEASRQNTRHSYILTIVGLVVGFGCFFIYIISGAASSAE